MRLGCLAADARPSPPAGLDAGLDREAKPLPAGEKGPVCERPENPPQSLDKIKSAPGIATGLRPPRPLRRARSRRPASSRPCRRTRTPAPTSPSARRFETRRALPLDLRSRRFGRPLPRPTSARKILRKCLKTLNPRPKTAGSSGLRPASARARRQPGDPGPDHPRTPGRPPEPRTASQARQ